MKEILKLAMILMLVTAVAATALAFVYDMTKEKIAAEERKAVKLSLAQALPIAAKPMSGYMPAWA